MALTQPTLILFEKLRREINYIPPQHSSEPFIVGNGTIILQTLRDAPDDTRFDLRVQSGKVNVGEGEFTVYGESVNSSQPYRHVLINDGANMCVNSTLNVAGDLVNTPDPGSILVNGTFTLGSGSRLICTNGGKVYVPTNGTFVIEDNAVIECWSGSKIEIYGKVNCSYSSVNYLIDSPNVYIDNGAIFNVVGLPSDRAYSMTDYAAELRKRYQTPTTIGSRYFSTGARVTYFWQMGSLDDPSDVLALAIETGDAVLGDFNLPIVGRPQRTTPYMQSYSSLTVEKGAILHIVKRYQTSDYVNPCLLLSRMPGNTESPGSCLVNGQIVCDGRGSSIKLDGGGNLTISAEASVHLRNDAKIISSENSDSPVLYINGRLIIDYVEQLEGFVQDNIVFGDNGKLVILNTNYGTDDKVLLSIPLGIKSSELYRLFDTRLKYVEFHIQPKTGIFIDEYYPKYGTMSDWYGGMRLEKAVYDGFVIWHEGGFIQLDSSITPWADDTATLLVVGNLFNVPGDTDKSRLQNLVDRLIYAGFKSINFKFSKGGASRTITLTLDSCYVRTVFYDPAISKYVIQTDNVGTLFIRDGLTSATIDDIVNADSRAINVNVPSRTEFSLQ